MVGVLVEALTTRVWRPPPADREPLHFELAVGCAPAACGCRPAVSRLVAERVLRPSFCLRTPGVAPTLQVCRGASRRGVAVAAFFLFGRGGALCFPLVRPAVRGLLVEPTCRRTAPLPFHFF